MGRQRQRQHRGIVRWLLEDDGQGGVNSGKEKGGAMMMTICRALRLMEEKRHQQCCRPMGGEDNKDDARQCTPSQAEGHAVGEEEDCVCVYV